MESIYELLSPIDFVIVGSYLAVLIAIGYWVSFVHKKNRQENLFLAGRSLSWPSIGFTMWGTNVGPSMLIASASIGYTSGLVAGNFGWFAFPFIFLLAAVFAPRYLGAKVSTLPEYMGKRFGQSTRNILAWYTIITILVSWLALTLYSGGILVSQILNFPMWLSIVTLVIISAFFAVAGGLKAIAYTNVFQMILLIIVSAVIAVVGVMKAGGPAELFHKTPSHYWNLLLPADDKNYPWIAIILGYPIMGVWFWCTDQSMVQGVLAAKNLKQGQLGANFVGWLKILDVALFIIPGIACYVLFPKLADPNTAYMTMVTQLFPAGMVGLVMAVLIAALVSTIDSALNSLSTVFTMDIYLRTKNITPDQSHINKIGRIVMLAGAFIAIFMALAIDTIKGLNLFDVFQAILGFIAPPMSAVFLTGLLWKRTTTSAANFILSAGTLFSLGTGACYLWIFPSSKYDFWPHFLLLSFFIFILLVLAAIAISLFGKQDEVRMAAMETSPKFTLSKKAIWPWVGLIIVMLFLYVFFNGH
jgi:solute:Na+ symporter, SSS family